MARKILILTEGLSSPHSAKTACGVIRFRRDEVVGVLDTTVPPQPVTWTLRPPQFTGQEIFTMGGDPRFLKAVDLGQWRGGSGPDGWAAETGTRP